MRAYVALLALAAGTLSLAFGILLGIYEILSPIASDGPHQENPSAHMKAQGKGMSKWTFLILLVVGLFALFATIPTKPVNISADGHYDEASGYFEI